MQIRRLLPLCIAFAPVYARADAGLMPPRVLLATGHGAVTRSGEVLVFEFERAPLGEVMAAVARVFSVTVAAPDFGSLEFSGRISAGTAAEALERIAEVSGWRLRGGREVWVLDRPAPPLPALRNAFAGAKGIR